MSDHIKRRLFRIRRLRRDAGSVDDLDIHRSTSPGPTKRLFGKARDDCFIASRERKNSGDYSVSSSNSQGSQGPLQRFMQARRGGRRRNRGERSMSNMSHSRTPSVDSASCESAMPTKPVLRTMQTAPPSLLHSSSSGLMNDPTHRPLIDGHSISSYETASIDSSADHHSSLHSHVPRRTVKRAAYSSSLRSQRKVRVRPYRCFPDGRTMTEEEIYTDSLKPSTRFELTKSYVQPAFKNMKDVKVKPEISNLYSSPARDGRIGSIRAEVLGCISLNRTKPEVAVYMVCGDSAFSTDVLTGHRSPMWPCESLRACVLPVHHAFAQLFVGVFDVKGYNKENDYFCGRVVIDLAALRPDTEYDVTLPLRASSSVYDRRQRGVIRLRFSLHWFSERAAIMSYFKPTKGLSKSTPFFDGHPTIPCADPKTFRNVAFTVYGQDLPGKYSRNAFKATVREINLYQQNIRLLVQVMALDAMLYEHTHVSLYLFVGSMYCGISTSVSLVPPFLVGYLILMFLVNYNKFVESDKYNLGYQATTIPEIFRGLVMAQSTDGSWMKPLFMEKRVKKKHGYRTEEEIAQTTNEVEIEPLDHREFPYSDREAYPKLSVEDSLAPGSAKGGPRRLHGRLSVYYSAPPEEEGEEDVSEEESGSNESIEHEEEFVGSSDAMFGLDLDEAGEIVDEDEMSHGIPVAHARRGSLIDTKPSERRIKLGPPQDVTLKGRKIPPQVQLLKVERNLHKATFQVSVERVHPPTNEDEDAEIVSAMTTENENRLEQEIEALKKRKAVYDEFDKLLRLQTRTANPVLRVMSSFLGPLMRMLRVFIYLFRISFHITTWRDPILSFWVLVALCALTLLLIFFPWKSFLLFTTFLSFGPQNILLRKYLEQRAARKAQEFEISESSDHSDVQKNWSEPTNSVDMTTRSSHSPHDGHRSRFRLFGGHKEKRQMHEYQRQASSPEQQTVDRPSFRPDHHVATSKTPRGVTIPYTRLRKDRFYDWPPDPTVSKATPMSFRNVSMERPRAKKIGSKRNLLKQTSKRSILRGSKRSLLGESTDTSADMPRGLRRRRREHKTSRDLYQ